MMKDVEVQAWPENRFMVFVAEERECGDVHCVHCVLWLLWEGVDSGGDEGFLINLSCVMWQGIGSWIQAMSGGSSKVGCTMEFYTQAVPSFAREFLEWVILEQTKLLQPVFC